MRIFLISSEYPPLTALGGIATYTRHLATGLNELGHEVHVITRNVVDEEKTSNVCGVTVHLLSHGSYPLPSGRLFYPLRKLCYILIPQSLIRLAFACLVCKKVEELIAEGKNPDCIEVPECGAEGFYLSRTKMRTSMLVRLHTPWFLVRLLDGIKESFLDRIVLDYLEKKVVQCATVVSSPTHALAEIVKKKWHRSDILEYPNPLPVSKYEQTSGNDWLFCGRVEMRKGVHILLESYALAKKTHTVPHLHIVGKAYGTMPDGMLYEKYIEDLIISLNIEKDVTWIRGTQDVNVYLLKANVAIFPSLWENFSYAALEAMASGLLVIAANCGGFKEIITHKKNGMLFSPKNTTDLCQCLITCIQKPAHRLEMAQIGREWVQSNIDSIKVCEKIVAVYKEL